MVYNALLVSVVFWSVCSVCLSSSRCSFLPSLCHSRPTALSLRSGIKHITMSQTQTSSMKAVHYEGPFKVSVKEIPKPKLEHPDDVIVKVTTACMSMVAPEAAATVY